jgi:hypothetical protein
MMHNSPDRAEASTVPPHSLSSAGRPLPAVAGYEVLEELGRGGMGVVYKARQEGLNRLVALKMVLAGAHGGEEERARFRIEVEATARLQHPNIVPIYEVGECDGCPYFSMELLDTTLAQQLDGTPWDAATAAELVITLAEAMQHAHERGIIHRDLKPANILLRIADCRLPIERQADTLSEQSAIRNPESAIPKISDFGLAKRIDEPGAGPRLTNSFALLGTPSYMAPEQAECASTKVGPAVDVYALGAILYQLLTGRPPFMGGTPVETVFRLLEDEPVPPARLNRDVPRELEAICLKCLEKEPGRRYASALSLAHDLQRFGSGEPPHARVLGPLGRVARWARRRPALATTLLALLVFYTNHVLLLFLGQKDERGDFHQFITGLMLAWAAGAAFFQWIVSRRRWQVLATFGWAGMDVLLLTALLYVKDGPRSPLAVGYLLLIAVTALRFRHRVVGFVTELCLVGYAALVVEAHLRRPWLLPNSPQVPVVFALSLLLMGLIMSLLLRRVRQE